MKKSFYHGKNRDLYKKFPYEISKPYKTLAEAKDMSTKCADFVWSVRADEEFLTFGPPHHANSTTRYIVSDQPHNHLIYIHEKVERQSSGKSE